MPPLSEKEKLLVWGAAMGLLLAGIVLAVCSLVPCCWIYKWLRKTKKGDEIPEIFDYDSQIYLSASKSKKSAPDASGGKPWRMTQMTDMGSSYEAEPRDHGQLSLHVQCSKLEEGSSQLAICVKDASDIPPREYGGLCSPYVAVEVHKTTGTKRSPKNDQVPLRHFRTSVSKRRQHPVYDERFTLDVRDEEEARRCWIKMAVFDSDRLLNDVMLGEAILCLGDLSLAEGVDLCVALNPPQQRDVGSVQLGLNYLPTAERLSVHVIKVSGIKTPQGLEKKFAPYARVLFMHQGKLLRKKKTSSKPPSKLEDFNESVTFDVPIAELANIAFVVCLSYNSSSRDGAAHLGHVVIGAEADGYGSQHWRAMLRAPRREVIQWHHLR